MAQVRRFDRGELQKPVKEPNGWVRVDAYLTRTGVFTYRTPDGKSRLEYRPPDEVFKADSLRTFEAVPFTNDHPPESLDATNTKKYQVGHLVGAPVQDGDKMRATILVTDAATVADMAGGKLEISNGYFCDLDETPGISPDGQRYDAIQRGITGNHVALVAQGRAGSEVRARMDATDAVMIASQQKPILVESATFERKTMKFAIDGVEVDVPEQAAQLFTKERDAAKARADAAATDLKKAQAERDAQAARADKAEKDAKELKADLEAAPEKLKKDMAERAKLEALALKVCGSEFKTDGLSDADVRKAIAAKQTDEKLDDKSDAYVQALVDLAAKRSDETAEVAAVIKQTQEVEAKATKPKTCEEAAAELFNRSRAKQ